MVESTDYSYLCMLYPSNADESCCTKIELPNNINATDFIGTVRHHGLSNIGKIKITRHIIGTSDKSDTSKTITIYVDDCVRTAAEVQNLLKRKYGSACGFYPRYGQTQPTVITGHKILQKGGIVPGHNVYLHTGDNKCESYYIKPEEHNWTEPYAIVKTLNKGDILVGRDFNQMFPIKTQQPPVDLVRFFEKIR